MASTGPNNFIDFLGDMFGFGIQRAVMGNSPKFRNERQVRLVSPQGKVLDCSRGQVMHIAQSVPHLNIVISKGAEMFSSMRVLAVDQDEVAAPKSQAAEAVKLLKRPNPMKRSTQALMHEYYINNAVYNSNLIYFNSPSAISPIPTAMWCLPPGDIEVMVTGKMYDQVDIEGIIEGFYLLPENRRFSPRDILYIWEGVSANGITPTSKIAALQMPLSNIVSSLKSQNIIINERGEIGFITPEGTAKDSDGALPFDSKQYKEVKEDYQKRNSLDSLGGHVGFSTQPLKWVQMTFDINQLQLKEGNEEGFCLICGEYGIDRDIFPSIKGATYENKAQGEKTTYNSTMQPQADKLMDELNARFNFTDGSRLIASYKHLPVMQEDELKCAQAAKVWTERNSILKKDGIIDAQSYADEEGVELTGSGETEHPPTSLSFGKEN
jgi:hypothetical protein